MIHTNSDIKFNQEKVSNSNFDKVLTESYQIDISNQFKLG